MSASCFFSGHTLLAVQAPPGTQLDVPIPKAVSSASLKATVVYTPAAALNSDGGDLCVLASPLYRSRTARQDTRSI